MSKSSFTSPIAGHVIEKIGGVVKTAALTGKAAPTVYKWRQPKDAGGTGGLIPTDAAQDIIAAARRGECDVTPDDFFPSEHPGENSNPAR
jgi:hypothetical protein